MSTGSLQRLARHLAGAVAPLDRLFRDADAYRALMWRLGWEADTLPGGATALADAARDAMDAVALLADGAAVGDVLAVVDTVGATYGAIGALSGAPAGVDVTTFRAEFPRQLFEHLLVDHLASELPGVLAALEAIGVVAYEDSPATAERPGFTRTRFDWDRLPAALADPDALPAHLYGWGSDAFDVEQVVEIATELADALGCSASLDVVAGAFASAIQSQSSGTPQGAIRCAASVSLFDQPGEDPPGEVTLSIAGLPAEGAVAPGLLLRPRIPPGTTEVDLGDGWSFAVRAGTDLSDELAIVLRPGDLSVRYPFSAGKKLPGAGLGATLAIGDGVPIVVLGDPGGIRVECARAALSFDLDDVGDGLDLALSLEPDGLALVLSGGALDSFLATILGDAELRVELDLGLRWSNRGGLSLVGGAGLAVTIPIDRAIGTVRIERVDLGLRLATGGASVPPHVALRATGTASGSIGPIVFSVEGLGVELPIVFADGNAGPFDVRFGVVWPTALGLGVDAEGIVTGGGFLDLDVPAGRYAGLAALQMLGVGLSAIGIIETKLPAPPGWSLFLSVIADFTPVPLGFGFTLSGVGGFMGLHRSFDELALAQGVREGRLDSLLFPEDPLADAPRLLADIEAFFPSLPDHHVFGVMARFGWGTPTLITAELGVILAVPDLEIALVGELATVLPREDLPLLELHMGVLGFVDVPAATAWVAASIYDSRLVGLTLAGDMAMYLALGDAPYFLLSVGGFHPAWTAPPSVPSSMTALRRMAATIDLGEALEIGVEAYLAVTSNTLQFGAEVHALARAREFDIDFTADGWFGFDVLLTLTPLSLLADMSAGVAIRAEGQTLAGIQLDLHLEGPEPWYGTGRAEFTFLVWDVPFHVEVGGRPAPEAPDTIDLWPVLAAAIDDPASWLAPAPAEVLPEVALRALDPLLEPGLWVRPDRALELRQRVLPLSRELDAYGALAPIGQTRFDVEAIGLTPGVDTDWTPVQDWFAAAQFTSMRTADRLSAPSFERMDAGAGLTAAVTVATRAADVTDVPIEYEEAVMRDRGRAPRRTRPLAASRLGLGLSRPALARSGPGGRRQTLAPTLAITPTRYAVVDPLGARVADAPAERGALASPRVTARAYADALRLRAALDPHHPVARGRLRIVPVHAAVAVAGATRT